MADAERVTRRQDRQNTHETNALGYGHLGTATYDNENQAWTFLRQRKTRLAETETSHVERIGDHSNSPAFQLVHERILSFDQETLNGSSAAGNATARDGLKGLLKRTPDAVIASDSVRSSANGPGVQLRDESRPRPSGSVLAFGNSRAPFQSGMHNNEPAIPIIAFPAGTGNEKLRLVSVRAQQLSIDATTDSEELCTVPSLGSAVAGTWSNSADPIQEVTCANPREGTQFLVVKSSGTSILRPFATRDSLTGHVASKGVEGLADDQGRRLDPCPLVTIPSSRTGGHAHAHAAANPRNPNIISIVDIRGQWSIWRLKGHRARSARVLYRVSLESQNSLQSIGYQASSSRTSSREDEWHKVCWLPSEEGPADQILVCNRQFAAVFTDKGKYVGQVDMRLGPQSARNVILDVKNSRRRRDHAFVLTTSRLMIFTSSEVSWKDSSGAEPLVLVCSWNHYRDRTDVSLSMRLLEFDQETWVLIYSTKSHFAAVYRFGHVSSTLNVVSLEDPSIFQMPQSLKARMQLVGDIALYPVDFTVKGKAPGELAYCLVRLVVHTLDGKIVEALYRHQLGTLGIAGKTAREGLNLPLPRTSVNALLSDRFVADDDLDDLDQFVVRDDTDEEHTAKEGEVPSSHPLGSIHGEPQFRDWQRVLDHILQAAKESVALSFESSLQRAMDQFGQLQMDQETSRMYLVSDLVSKHQIVDVEQDSEFAEAWLDDLKSHGSISVNSAADPARLHEVVPPSLLKIYDDLMSAYVESLSPQVTDRTRVNRERLVRRIAGDVFLGNLILKDRKAVEAVESSYTDPISTPPGPHAEELEEPSVSQSPQPNEEPAVSRLRQYTAFRHEVPPLLLSHNAATSHVLAHIPGSIEEDPANYSYQHVNQTLKLVQEEMATQSLDPRERRKAARQAARLQRKREKAAQIGRDVISQRILLPTITSGGGGFNLPGRDVQSSQLAGPASSQNQDGVPGLTMTQPERGAFGARPAKKKGKEKGASRRAGF